MRVRRRRRSRIPRWLVSGSVLLVGAVCFALVLGDPAILFLCCTGTTAVLGVAGLVWVLRWQGGRRVASSLEELDALSPYAFESAVGRLMAAQGFTVRETGRAGDQGVDLIAEYGATRYAVQVKQYTTPVDRTAVSDAVAGMRIYGCNGSMVVTNSRFRPGALELAQANGTVLVDREGLAAWIRNAHRQDDQADAQPGAGLAG